MSQSPHPAAASGPSPFLLCTCQGGAEAALRQRFGDVFPAARPGAWRRGVVSFRLPEDQAAQAAMRSFDLVFARTVIHSFGQVTGDSDATRLAAACSLAGRGYDNVHVWPRDPRADQPVAEIRAGLLESQGLDPQLSTVAAPGTLVLDCLLDSAERWWVGWHRCDDMPSRWPGGLAPRGSEPLPEACVSRAWLKLDEAISVFGIPLQPGQRALELGAAPGGACQRLLEAGLEVVGVDPAVIDPCVTASPRFEQWRMRAREVPLRRCVGFDWLLADMNIDPKSTMAAVARIASAPGVRLRGIVATLKLPDWSRAAELPGWLETFRGCGFEPRARQLSTGGREICVVAVRPEQGVRSRTAARTGGRSASGSVTRRRARHRPGR